MGIQGLLVQLKSSCSKVHISQYANCKVAVDGYCWLHRGAYSCSTELCQQVPTQKHLNFCMHYVRMLRHYKVIPVIVFDGARLPKKSNEEQHRRVKRKKNLEKALELKSQGAHSQADEYFRKAVDITPKMAYEWIQLLKQEHVEYIVAPYEADAQLAFLARTNYVQCVITEDSDLLAYATPRILFKMDKYGNGTEIVYSDLASNDNLCLIDFTPDMVTRMCILSGCDYLSSLPGIGIKKACKIVKQHKTIEKIVKALSREYKVDVPEDYEDEFIEAEMTFKHQRVWNPLTQRVINLTPLPEGISDDDVSFLGPVLDEVISRKICLGIIDPSTHRPFESSSSITTDGNLKITSFSGFSAKKKEDDIPHDNHLLRHQVKKPNLLLSCLQNSLTAKTRRKKKKFVSPLLGSQGSSTEASSSDLSQGEERTSPKIKVIRKSKYFASHSGDSSQCESIIKEHESEEIHIKSYQHSQYITSLGSRTSSQCSVDDADNRIVSNEVVSKEENTARSSKVLSQGSIWSISSSECDISNNLIGSQDDQERNKTKTTINMELSQSSSTNQYYSPFISDNLSRIGISNKKPKRISLKSVFNSTVLAKSRSQASCSQQSSQEYSQQSTFSTLDTIPSADEILEIDETILKKPEETKSKRRIAEMNNQYIDEDEQTDDLYSPSSKKQKTISLGGSSDSNREEISISEMRTEKQLNLELREEIDEESKSKAIIEISDDEEGVEERSSKKKHTSIVSRFFQQKQDQFVCLT